MKNKKALYLLFAANVISGFAQGLTMLSIPLYFSYQNQPSVFMISYGVVTVGSLFWGLYAGALVDGFNRRDVFLGTNFIEGLIVLSIAWLGFNEGTLPSSLIIMVFATTFFGYIIHYPNLYAFAQEISDPKDYGKVTVYIEVVGQATAIAAAALGVFLINGVDTIAKIPFTNIEFELLVNKWQQHEIFLLDGTTYIISFILIMFIKYRPIINLAQRDEGDLGERLKTGFDFLNKNILIKLFGICSYSVFIVLLVERFGLLPVFVKNNLQEAQDIAASSEILYGAGSLVAGFLVGPFLARMPIPKSIIFFILLTSSCFFISGMTDSVFVFMIVSFLFGIANAGSRIFRITYLFMLVPNAITGRVNSVFNVYTTVFRLIFIMIFGYFHFFYTKDNIVYAYFILGGFTFVSAMILIVLYKPLLVLTDKHTAQTPSH